MKTLHIIRHFKSDWEGNWSLDYERDLNSRGKADIPLMAKKMKLHGANPGLILLSSALRTRRTCSGLVEHCGWEKTEINAMKSLYGADVPDVFDQIRSVDDRYAEIALIGHNPTMTDLINELSPARLDNLPTGGWAQIELDVDSWKDLARSKGTLIVLEYPKKQD